jgi:hypothetical protein
MRLINPVQAGRVDRFGPHDRRPGLFRQLDVVERSAQELLATPRTRSW